MTTIAQCSGASLSEDAGDAVLDDGAMFNPEVNDDLGTVATVANSVSARTLRGTCSMKPAEERNDEFREKFSKYEQLIDEGTFPTSMRFLLLICFHFVLTAAIVLPVLCFCKEL